MDRTDTKSSPSKDLPESDQLHWNRKLRRQESVEVMVSNEESCVFEEQAQENEAEDEKRGSEKDGVPYDSGWAWMVMFGCFINYLTMGGYGQSFGLFYVALLQHYRAQASETALIFSIRAGVYSFSSWIVMNFLFARLGARGTAVIGAVLVSLSAIVSSFVNGLMLIICLLGIMHGVGRAMIWLPGDVLLASYFRKRRSLAIPFARCGISFGTILMPIAVSYFLEHYGLSGALLLTGSLCLHAVPAAMLQRPISFYRRRRVDVDTSKSRFVNSTELNESSEATVKLIRNDNESQNPDTLQTIEMMVTKQPAFEENTNCPPINKESPEGKIRLKHEHLRVKSSSLTTFKLVPSHPELRLPSKNTVTCHKRRCSLPELPDWRNCSNSADTKLPDWRNCSNSADTKLKWREWKESQTLNVCNSVTEAAPTVEKFVDCSQDSNADCTKDANGRSHFKPAFKTVPSNEEKEQQSHASARNLAKCPKSVSCMLDFSLFGNPLFCLLLAYMAVFPCTIMMIAYLPALASEKNLTASQGALLLSITGGLGLVCRLSCVVIANAKIVRVSTMIATSCLILGVTAHFVRFMTSLGHFVALSVLLGLLDGVSTTMLPILVVDFVGLDNMAKAQGFFHPMMGAFSAGIYPLLGYVRDVTGSYTTAYHVLGSAAILAAAILSCERWVRRLAERKQEKASQRDFP